MNYGSIGQIIGHEITHGFDDQGRQFDLNGNLVDWWQDDTEAKFATKAECIIRQVSFHVCHAPFCELIKRLNENSLTVFRVRGL